MSERVTFQVMNPDGTYTDNITVWSHVLKDGFTRTENDNWFRIMVREQSALSAVLKTGSRIKWKSNTLSIFSWQDPSYEDRGFIEIMAKQIVTVGLPGTPEGSFFKDVVSIFSVSKIPVNQYGLISYKYEYDFTTPNLTGILCNFSSDRNIYLEDKNKDTEHDSVIVKFDINTPLKIEDYIESPLYGRFKVDLIVKNDMNMLEAYCQRAEVQ